MKLMRMAVFLLSSFMLIPFSHASDAKSDEDAPIYKLKIVQPYKQTIPHKVTLPKLTDEVKLITDLGLLFINVYINGKGPFVFWLDTGSEITMVSSAIAKELNLPIVAKTKQRIKASHSYDTIESILTLGNINIGQTTFHQAPIFTLDESHKAFSLLKNLDVVGIIGMNMFYDLTLTLDIANNRFFLQKHFIPDENAVRLTGMYFSPVISVKFNSDGKVEQIPFLVDSGFNGGVEMPTCKKDIEQTGRISHSLDFFSQVETGYNTTLKGKMTIGLLDFRNPEVRFVPSNCKKSKPFGLIGTKFLRDKLVSINLRKRLLSVLSQEHFAQQESNYQEFH